MHGLRRGLIVLACVAAVYGLLAYVVLPLAWTHHEHQKGLAGFTMVTHTGDGIPGDPINVGLVGSLAEVLCAMHAAGWYPADPITLRSSIEIVGSVLLDRPYRDAPVSNLYFLGRRQDLAFEKPVGGSARRRNHVRYWLALASGDEGRPVWLGSATLDTGVELSRDTGQVTHRISPDIDAERATLIGDLRAVKVAEATYEVSGIGPTLGGRNGGGDRYFTDGEIAIARLATGCGAQADHAIRLDNPVPVQVKNWLWHGIVAKVLSAL